MDDREHTLQKALDQVQTSWADSALLEGKERYQDISLKTDFATLYLAKLLYFTYVGKKRKEPDIDASTYFKEFAEALKETILIMAIENLRDAENQENAKKNNL